ncbi:hypothetical protein IH781_04110 [Patescibacteria group bacterium]|nr:hypothetical protein [Patescibacteria group bacterium]
MIDIAYTIFALVPVTVALIIALIIAVLTFRVVLSKIALSSGLTPEQADLIASLSNQYVELSRIRGEAGQRESDILTQGEAFTASCREELWSPTRDQENIIAVLEQQCRGAGIPEWRLRYWVLENPLG